MKPSAIFAMCIVTTALAACSEDDGRQALPDWSEGYEDTLSQGDDDDSTDPTADASVNDNIQEGLTSELPDDAFGLGIPADAIYPVRLRKLNTVGVPCAIRDGEEAEITCIMEMDELDIAGTGIAYDIVMPEGLCDFIFWESYMFENWEIGVGPSEVSWTEDHEGNISNEVNAHGGEPECPYDYSEQYYGPNCCYGEYVQTVTHLEADGGIEEATVTHGEWMGGKQSDCFDGAAFLDKDAVFDEAGWPLRKYVYLNREATTIKVEYKPILENYGIDSATYFNTTVLLANYWDPADHNGGVPAAYTKVPPSNIYYEFECTDDAWEIIARIHLIVREWNEESQFDLDGDPDTTGTEPAWNHPIDDLADWAVLTPGDQDYPHIYAGRW